MSDGRSSAAYRIAFIYTAAFAFGVGLLGVVVFYAMHVRFVRQLDASLAEEAVSLAEEYRTGGNVELAEALDKRQAVETGDLSRSAVYNASGQRLFGNLESRQPRVGFHDIALRDREGNPDLGRSYGIAIGGGEHLFVATDLEPVEQIDRTVITLFASGFAGIVALGIGGALLLGGYLRRRLEGLSSSAETIISGETSHRMPVSSRNDEFDRLAVSLNAMLDRIEGLLDNLRQVSSDVAHDLRTPLTRLRNDLERGEGGVDHEGVIARAISQVDQTLALFGAILRISEIESGQVTRRFEQVDVSELVSEIAESYAPAIEEQRRTLSWHIDRGVVFRADRDLLAQAVINLIENAQRHTPEGSHIEMQLNKTEDNVLLSVTDDGPGVPTSEWPRIVKRFVRLDRSRSSRGHGLGLSLVSAVAQMHGGTLAFADNSPGLVARIAIPWAPA